MAEDYSSLAGVSPLLTTRAVDEALSRWFQEPCTFTHWEHVGDVGKGDHYLSEVLRIKVHGRTQRDTRHLQLILKRLPRSEARRRTFRSHEFFRNEINFYNEVLPVLLRFQEDKKPPDPFQEYATLFLAVSNGTDDVVCLEDASLQHFRSAVRQKGIDLDHCKSCFRTLARFHALSFALKDQHPERFEEIRQKISEVYFHERYFEWYRKFWDRVCGIAVDAVEKEYPDSVYLKKIKEFCVPERYWDLVRVCTDTLDTGVISHGDCWTNNFLFKYEDDKVTDAKIIDFQLTRCATPIMDLSFFIYACTTKELRDRHFDEWLQFYYEELARLIRALGSDPDRVYSKELFMAEVKKYFFFGLAVSLETTPIIVLEPEDAVSMEMEDDAKLSLDEVWSSLGPFRAAEGRRREAHNIVHAVDRGYI